MMTELTRKNKDPLHVCWVFHSEEKRVTCKIVHQEFFGPDFSNGLDTFTHTNGFILSSKNAPGFEISCHGPVLFMRGEDRKNDGAEIEVPYEYCHGFIRAIQAYNDYRRKI